MRYYDKKAIVYIGDYTIIVYYLQMKSYRFLNEHIKFLLITLELFVRGIILFKEN